ncbi:MAG: hypothetical protein ABR875_02190 [Minisyncoccia bacterium]
MKKMGKKPPFLPGDKVDPGRAEWGALEVLARKGFRGQSIAVTMSHPNYIVEEVHYYPASNFSPWSLVLKGIPKHDGEDLLFDASDFHNVTEGMKLLERKSRKVLRGKNPSR